MNLKNYVQDRQAHFNQVFQKFLSVDKEIAPRLTEAMLYSLEAGGKRMRPLLVYAAGELFGAKLSDLDRAACCIEFVHTYSLIHDDLPAMDNSDMRRDRPSCHKTFDEATAILAGNALQNLAYELILEDDAKSAELRLDMLQTLTNAVGVKGVLSGQMLDLNAGLKPITLDLLEQVHRMKTAVLVAASVKLGALASNNCDAEKANSLEKTALDFGMAFQIGDDIQDQEEEDAFNYVKQFGLSAAYERLDVLYGNVFHDLEAYSARPENPLYCVIQYIKDLIYTEKK